MPHELSEKIMKEFVRLTAEKYSHSTYDNDENKKAKGRKKCVIKRKIKFEDYKICLEATQL